MGLAGEDIVACSPQPREAFDTVPPAFPGLLGPAAEPERFLWHMLRNLNQHAIDANGYFRTRYGQSADICFTSGYRTPKGNLGTSGSSSNSNHLYGRAFDFVQGSSWGNYYAYKASYDAGARMDTYLVKSDNTLVFWYQNPPLPSTGITYIRGHSAWQY